MQGYLTSIGIPTFDIIDSGGEEASTVPVVRAIDNWSCGCARRNIEFRIKDLGTSLVMVQLLEGKGIFVVLLLHEN